MAMSPKRKRFADEWLKDFNGTQAAIRAGYTKSTADITAMAILKDAETKAYIDSKLKKQEVKADLTRERILLELSRIALFDNRKLYRADGSLKQPHEWDDETAAVVSQVDVVESSQRETEFDEDVGEMVERHVPVYTKKIKTNDKNTALTLAMRHYGMLQDNLSVTGANGGPISHVVKVMSDEDLERIIAEGDQ